MTLQLCGPCQQSIKHHQLPMIKISRYWWRKPHRQNGWSCALCIAIHNYGNRNGQNDKFYIWQRGQVESFPRLLSRYSNSDSAKDMQVGLKLENPQRYWTIGSINDMIIYTTSKDPVTCSFECEPVSVFGMAGSLASLNTPVLRIVPWKEIDGQLVRQWLTYCERNHIDCHDTSKDISDSTNIDIRLIDVRRRKIVRSTTTAKYVALSYVWGGVPQLLLTQSNLADMEKDGALQRHWEEIPLTLKDAIQFVETISEPYLWIDTLCIVQDASERHFDIAHMDKIYSAALCTLVAIDSKDASGGLPGVRPGSRNHAFMDVKRDLCIAKRRADLESIATVSKYEHRAWTLQERFLSRRCVFFTSEQLYFQCQTALWSEDRYEHYLQSSGVSPAKAFLAHNGVDSSWWSQFIYYTRLVQQYTQRELSYSTDRLRAFSGIANHLSTQWNWDFLGGLPAPLLTTALLWVSTKWFSPRIDTDNMGQRIPSWSWAGWGGGIHYRAASRAQYRPAFSQYAVTTPGNAVKFFDFPDITAHEESAHNISHSEMEDELKRVTGSLKISRPLNMLVFATQMVPESHFFLNETSPLIKQRYIEEDYYGTSIFQIRDRSHLQRACGLLLYHTTFDMNGDFYYILISESNQLPLISILEETNREERDNNYIRDNVYDKYYARQGISTMNVLLVRWTNEGYAERVALAQIHTTAWMEADPVATVVCLA
jgi:hypothetical protein